MEGQEPDLVEQFSSELTALGGVVIRLKEKEFPDRLGEFLQARGVERILVDDVGAKYAAPLEKMGISLVREPDPTVVVGVTGALAGIAETGSVILLSGEGETLKASLLTEIHVAILKRSQLVPTLAEALAKPGITKRRREWSSRVHPAPPTSK